MIEKYLKYRMKAKIIFSALLLGLLATQAAVAAKPNIVYVIADEWRAAAMSYSGDPNVKTPNLDRLAQQSQNFRNAVSVCPVCTPHRAALMTGRYPTSTGMFLNDLYLPSSELCMAEIFDAAGYTTGLIGKWHLDGHGRASYIPPERRQGFEYWKGAECDHDYNHSHYYTGTSDVKRYWEGYDALAQTKDAQQYLRAHAGTNQPFLLYISFGPPHFPFETAPAEFKSLYASGKIKLSPNVPPAMQAGVAKDARGYYAHCTAVDQCVGDLLKTLDETGLATNTIFVFSSDHGETLGSHGVPPANKQVAWSDSAQVPFLMRVPGIAGRMVETPLTTPDILPTLLGLAGVNIPGTIEGADLSPLIRAGRDEDRVALYLSVLPFSHIPKEFKKEYRAIRTSRYTYVRSLAGPWLLFDDKQDSDQTNNLVGKPEAVALVYELDKRLQAELKRVGDDFRPSSAYVSEWGYKLLPNGTIGYKDRVTEVQTPKRQPTVKLTVP